MSEEPTEVRADPAAPMCYRHPDRETHIRCQRCDRPICPDCMRSASVGFHCPDCVKEGARSTRQGRTAYGGRRPTSAAGATLGIIGINLVVFVLVLATGGAGSDLLDRLALLPADTLYRDGLQVVYVQGVSGGAWWQLVTSMFTHVQLWHIGFNMMALYFLGPELEMLLGRARYLALYLLSGLVGSAAVMWLSDPHQQTIGASGALFGLMAALLVVAVKVGGQVQALVGLIAVNVVITVLGVGYISWQGHLGGFVGGTVIGMILVYAPREHRTVWQVSGLAAIGVLTLAAVMVRMAVLA